jgi:hypothetical protein
LKSVDVSRVQLQLASISLSVLHLDLDKFIDALEYTNALDDVDTDALSNSKSWLEVALLLKPFRDQAVRRVLAIRARSVERTPWLYVPEKSGCPGCGERRLNAIGVNRDGSRTCSTCSRQYCSPTMN